MQARPAHSSDAARIVQILRENFPTDRLPLTIFGCQGIESYVRDLIECQNHGSSMWYSLVADDSRVAGFVEVRRDPVSLFLNHGFLEPAVRGPCVGTSLLHYGMVQARDAAQTHVALDVFHDNTSVRRGHRALGFRETHESWWLEFPLEPTRRPAGPWYVHGHNQAELIHGRYGFSELSVETARRTYRVGQLGDRFFRVTDPTLLADPCARDALRTLDPARRLLCIAAAEFFRGEVPFEATVRARAFRMTAKVDPILRSLAAMGLLWQAEVPVVANFEASLPTSPSMMPTLPS